MRCNLQYLLRRTRLPSYSSLLQPLQSGFNETIVTIITYMMLEECPHTAGFYFLQMDKEAFHACTNHGFKMHVMRARI